MKFIAHRGNLCGACPSKENRPSYIDEALTVGFDAEIDIWFFDALWLGHDVPQYRISLEWLHERAKYLWIHCKNLSALNSLLDLGIFNVFWHEHDLYTLTSRGFIWSLAGYGITSRTVVVDLNRNEESYDGVYGICTDYSIK